MTPDPRQKYYLDLEIRAHDLKKGKGIGIYNADQQRWELHKIYFEEPLTAQELKEIVTVGYNPLPEEIPNLELFKTANEAALKDKDFENKVGLIMDTLEDMVLKLFGGTKGYFDAMMLAGYVSFDPLEALPNFPGANKVFKGPDEWKDSTSPVKDLAVHFDQSSQEITSIWKAMSPAHRLRFLFDGLITLTIHGRGMPPVSVVSGFFPDLEPPLIEKSDM